MYFSFILIFIFICMLQDWIEIDSDVEYPSYLRQMKFFKRLLHQFLIYEFKFHHLSDERYLRTRVLNGCGCYRCFSSCKIAMHYYVPHGITHYDVTINRRVRDIPQLD